MLGHKTHTHTAWHNIRLQMDQYLLIHAVGRSLIRLYLLAGPQCLKRTSILGRHTTSIGLNKATAEWTWEANWMQPYSIMSFVGWHPSKTHQNNWMKSDVAQHLVRFCLCCENAPTNKSKFKRNKWLIHFCKQSTQNEHHLEISKNCRRIPLAHG